MEYLASIAVSIAGICGGLAVAFWYRSEFNAAKGLVGLTQFQLKVESDAHDKSLKQALKDAKDFEDDSARKEKLIESLQVRLQEVSTQRLAVASMPELINLANRVFPDKNGSKVARPGGDSGKDLPSKPSTRVVAGKVD